MAKVYNYQHVPGKYQDLLKNGRLKKKILREGKNDYHPGQLDIVYLHFDAKDRKSGKTYYSTLERGELYRLQLADFNRTDLKGFDAAVPTMKMGEISRLIAKPEYAYGEEGHKKDPKVPPDCQIIFEVELVKWEYGDSVIYDKVNEVTKSVQQEGDVGGRYPGPRLRLRDPQPIVQLTIKGYYDDDGMLGKQFLNSNYRFEVGEHHERDLPDGVDKAVQRMKQGERMEKQLGNPLLKDYLYLLMNGSLVRMKGQNSYRKGHEAYGIAPQATIIFEITLDRYLQIPCPNYAAADERLRDANYLKDKGTSFYNFGKYEEALQRYRWGYELTRIEQEPAWIVGHKKKSPAPMEDYEEREVDPRQRDWFDPLKNQDWNEEQWVEREELAVSCALNAALCCTRLGGVRFGEEGIYFCDLALLEKPAFIKALYRKAQNFEVLEQFDDAVSYYKRILKMEPHHRAARQSIRRVRRMGGLLEDVASQVQDEWERLSVLTAETRSWVTGATNRTGVSSSVW